MSDMIETLQEIGFKVIESEGVPDGVVLLVGSTADEVVCSNCGSDDEVTDGGGATMTAQ